jgi:Fur family ferric uptake transcriptional regulator
MAPISPNITPGAAKGVLKVVSLPGQSTARYELCGKAHHHHFHCRLCHQVYEVEGCPGNIEPLIPRGFTLEDHELVLYGRCSACRGKSAKTSR